MILRALGLSFLALIVVVPANGFAPAPERKRVELGKNVFFETEGATRRVIVKGKVVLREGRLEGLVTRAGLKEHEYILAVDADARVIHAGLVAANGKPGKVVQYEPKYAPPTGSEVKITLRYKKEKETVTVSARDWVRTAKDMKALDRNWVFAGSQEVPDLDDSTKKVYLANQGDIVCLCNMDTAMLDLAAASPKAIDDRLYEANPDKIPPAGTEVEIIMEVVPEKK
jgi:hypothetical protein